MPIRPALTHLVGDGCRGDAARALFLRWPPLLTYLIVQLRVCCCTWPCRAAPRRRNQLPAYLQLREARITATTTYLPVSALRPGPPPRKHPCRDPLVVLLCSQAACRCECRHGTRVARCSRRAAAAGGGCCYYLEARPRGVPHSSGSGCCK